MNRLELSEALRIWMHHCSGWPQNPPQKPDSREYHADRRKALADLKPITRSEQRVIERTVARPSLRWGVPGRHETQQQTIVAHWVDREDLIRLAGDHGIDFDVDEQDAQPKRNPGPKPKNAEAVAYAEKLIDDGMQQTAAVLEAAEQFDKNPDSIERTIRRRRQSQ